MKAFYKLLVAALIVGTTNNFVWFALTFWIYLGTKSVVSTGMVAGIYLIATALSGMWFGSLVDHKKKKYVMLGSSAVTLTFFIVGFLVYHLNSPSAFTSVTSPALWLFVIPLMLAVVAGNIFNIAVPTLVAHLVPKDQHDKANGMFGTVTGIAFAITSVASGTTLAFGGMFLVLIVAIILTVFALIYLAFLSLPEKKVIHRGEAQGQKNLPAGRQVDIMGTIKVIRAIPGLFALIFYATFNNFLGGVFMALMDAYGLSLVSVQIWGFMFGILSMGFIIGGLIIAKKGLGKNPLKTLLRVNIVTWTVCIFFTIQPSIILLFIGMAFWMTLYPFVEASEQTVIQKVVPPERLGRVFGFSQSIEQAAAPFTAFLIGPIAQFIFIPFMTTGKGVERIGGWFGTGTGRGIALVFIIAGIIGLIVTLLTMRSKSYKLLTAQYKE